MGRLAKIAVALVMLVVVGYGVCYQLIWRWTICRTYCPAGQSLLLTRKTGDRAPLDAYAEPGQMGVQEQMAGPGRHFFNPWVYSLKDVEDVEVVPGKIGIVKNNVGKDQVGDGFIAAPDEKGTQLRVLTPGLWRVNTHGQKIELREATLIDPGYVGVQTLREGKTKGVLSEVLQPGYYNVNPFQRRIDIVEIGYRVWTSQAQFSGGRGARRKAKEGSGVSFPLADGKEMYLDFTVVWGVFPKDAPRIIGEYGTIEMVESKIIVPQVLSICKNLGSNLTTQEFIEGETREKFQAKVTQALQVMGRNKGIHILIALVRGFHPAEDIKETIQARMIAEEEKETLLFEQETDRVAAQLEEAKKIVDIALRDYDAETVALVAGEQEGGAKKAAEIQAKADQEVASFLKQTAEVDALALKIEGQAKADVTEAKKKAEAKKLQLLISAFGGADAFNLFTFAENLPPGISIKYRYAGEGTLWTDSGDLKGVSSKKLLEYLNRKEKE